MIVKSIKSSKEIKKNSEYYPLEYITKLVIKDELGLDYLLKRTKKAEYKEWSTIFNVTEQNGTGSISNILTEEEVEKKYPKYHTSIDSVHFSREQAQEDGFQGFQHYHPIPGAFNYKISLFDRSSPKNFIDLLTFNRSGGKGPEIIGYNHNSVFIPTNKQKTKFAAATPEQIMRYLETGKLF